MLRVSDLTIYYRTLAGPVKALDGVSFAVRDGEIMGLAGESGCGKSTLGKALIRLDDRMQLIGGEVTLDGTTLPLGDDRAMVPHRFKHVSIVPQYAMSALNPTRRIGRMIDELLEARGIRGAALRPELERRLGVLGLAPDVLGMYPIELSGGMKQRVVMVLSTLLNPALLIADEVTSALDVASQKKVAGALVEFRDRGYVKSMIVVTHDLAILAQIADSIMIMYAGKLAEKAPTTAIIEKPAHPYTRLLLGSLPDVGIRFETRRLPGIKGRPPSLLDPPAGCRFRDRCPLASEKCAEEPPFIEIAPDHTVACWKADSHAEG